MLNIKLPNINLPTIYLYTVAIIILISIIQIIVQIYIYPSKEKFQNCVYINKNNRLNK